MAGPHILVLEDEAPVRMLLEKILTSAGYRVTAVADGGSALKAAREHPPDLVISDLGVPGLSGQQVITMFGHDRTFHAPIMVVSGHLQDKEKEAALKAGAAVFLPKPVERETLLAEVSRLLSREQHTATVEAGGEGEYVIVLEGESEARRAIMNALIFAGYRVTGLSDAEEAVSKISFKPPHLLICDMFLPGVAGDDLIRRLRREVGFTSPIIAVSARSDEATERDALDAGANSVLPKPVPRQLLLDHVSSLLSKKAD